jgi:hypothetical protein
MTIPQRLGAILVPFLVLLTAGRAPASAGIIEKLSGPGPFLAFQIPFDRLVCAVRRDADGIATGTIVGGAEEDIWCAYDGGPDPMRIRAYLSAEYTQGFSHPFTDENGEFPQISVKSLKPILFFRLHESVDAGVGVSANRFSGTAFSGADFAFWRVSIPMRARITWPWLRPNSPWRGVHVAIQADYFPGVFTGPEFGAAPGTAGAAFREENDVVKSWFISVDVLRLVSRRWRSL